MMMAPLSRRLLSLLLLFILFLLLLSLSSLFYSPQIQTQQLLSLQTSSFPPPHFTFLIKLLTFNRLSSLSRCLNSLSSAHYDAADKVHLHICMDHFHFPLDSADSDHRLNTSRRILDFVDGFDWRFGERLVHYRTSNAGLQGQWLEAWWPTSDHEFAFVVEDDLEISPLYYRFLKAVILNYYYNATNFSPSIYGLVGTWGQLLFPRPWKEFRLWYGMHKSKGNKWVVQEAWRENLDSMVYQIYPLSWIL